MKTKYDEKMSSLKGHYPIIGGPKPMRMSDIFAVETFINHKLPGYYLEFVSKYGGFGLLETSFPIAPYSGGDSGGIGVFCGIGQPEGYDLLDHCKAYKGRMPSHMLPIADDRFGSVICLSLDGWDKGYVYFWDHHEDSGEDPPDTSNLHLIAKSFDEFIESLRYEEA